MKKIYFLLLFLSALCNSVQAQCTITYVSDLQTPSGTGTSYTHRFRLKNSSTSNCNAVNYTIVGYAGYYKSNGNWISCDLNSNISMTPFSATRNSTVDVTVNFSVAPVCGNGEYKIEFSIRDGNNNPLTPLPGGRLYSLFTYNCPTPTNLGTSNIAANEATFNWNGSIGSYVLRYRKVGTSTWSTTGFINNSTSRTITSLLSGTTYEWQVQSACGDFWGSSWVAGSNITTTSPTTRIIGLSPSSIGFGTVNVNQSTTRNITVSNSGTATLSISSISFPSGFSGNWSSRTIGAGQSATLTVTFNPTSANSYSGDITFNSDATSGGNTVSVSGTGNNPCVAPSALRPKQLGKYFAQKRRGRER